MMHGEMFLHGKNCCGTAENNHEALAEAPVLPVRIPVGERHNGSNHNRRSPKSNLQGLPSIDHDFSRPVAQHGLSPWSSSHLAPRGLSPWTDQTSFLSQDNVRILRQNAQPRTSEPREALKDATKRLPRSAHILQRRTEGITHTVKKVVDAPQHQYILSGTDDDAARRDLNSRGEPNATSPRWGRVFTSQRSLFEPCIRTQQLSASASTPRRRGLTSKICKEDPRRRAAPHAEVETPEQVSQREAIPKNPQVPPIVREGQSFHFSPQSYCDLVRRHNVSVRYTPGSNCNSIPRIPDSQALKRIRYKKLAAASGKGPLARGLKHSVQNRSDTKPHTPAAMNEDDYVRKLETDPNDLHVLACYADLLARKNRLVEAENTYRRALALPVHGRSDDYAEILYAYAMFLWTTDRCMKAEKYFELGLKYNSAHFDLLCNYGLAMFARGAYAAAKERFFRASILRPGDVRSKLGYAICLEYIGKSPCEDIAKVYDGIFALDPDYPEAVFSCARFWKTHDKRELAWKYYRKALALKPYDAAWLCSYGNFLSEEASSAFLKRTHEAGCHWRALFAQAEAVFLTALRLAPRDAIVMHAFAVTLSVKLRLLLFAAGDALKDREACRDIIRDQEQSTHGESKHVEAARRHLALWSNLTSESVAVSGTARMPHGQTSFLINSPTGRPERFTEFRHEHVLNKSFANKVDGPKHVSARLEHDIESARLKLQSAARGHRARKEAKAIRLENRREAHENTLDLPFDLSQTLATNLFEHALILQPTESHVIGAYAIFLFLVIGHSLAIERARELFALALRQEHSASKKDAALYFLDLLRLHCSQHCKFFTDILGREWGLEDRETERPLTPDELFQARLAAIEAGLPDPKESPKVVKPHISSQSVSHQARQIKPHRMSTSGSKLTVKSLTIETAIPSPRSGLESAWGDYADFGPSEGPSAPATARF